MSNVIDSGKIKRKFSFDEMIDHLEKKNVQFNLVSKEKAKTILMESNYYYKISAYRKNFDKRRNGEYINLEFAYLTDLAAIDMRLRYVVLQMCLDIEHSIKTKLLTDITNDPSEDGYQIVKDFCKFDKTSLEKYMKGMSKNSHYNYGLYSKHHKNPPVWVFFEVLTFGAFVKFVEFYYLTRNNKAYLELFQVLKYVKNIRNSAAHNNPIIMDIVAVGQLTDPITKPVSSFVIPIKSIKRDLRRKKLTNRKIHDLTALFFVYDTFVTSTAMKKIRYESVQDLLERCKRYKKEYANHNGLISVYNYFSKMVDHLT